MLFFLSFFFFNKEFSLLLSVVDSFFLFIRIEFLSIFHDYLAILYMFLKMRCYINLYSYLINLIKRLWITNNWMILNSHWHLLFLFIYSYFTVIFCLVLLLLSLFSISSHLEFWVVISVDSAFYMRINALRFFPHPFQIFK